MGEELERLARLQASGDLTNDEFRALKARLLKGLLPEETASPIVEEPLTVEERLTVAKRCDARLDLSPFTVVIDDIEDTASTAYAALPDRLYLVDKEGRVAYAGGRGPREFFPNELEDSIREELGLEPIEHEEEEERGSPFRRRPR